MKISYNNTILILLPILFLFTCQQPDDFPHPYHEGCETFPDIGGTGYWYEDLDTVYTAPFFNPENSSEFLFIKSYTYYPQPNWQSSKRELWIYNMASRLYTKLSDKVWLDPKWGSNGWIVFNREDAQLWKIKSDGIQLKQLTYEGENYHPSWSPDGKNIVFFDYDKDSDHNLRIMSSEGELGLETLPIPGRASYPTWSPNGRFISASTDNLYHLDLETNEVTIISDSSYLQLGPKQWFPDGSKIVWTSAWELAVTEVESKETTILRKNCDAYKYGFCSVNKEGTKILTTRLDSKIVGGDSIYTKSRIVMMNVDGTGEEVILE